MFSLTLCPCKQTYKQKPDLLFHFLPTHIHFSSFFYSASLLLDFFCFSAFFRIIGFWRLGGPWGGLLSNPNSKQGQMWGQIKLFRAWFTQDLKTSNNADWSVWVICSTAWQASHRKGFSLYPDWTSFISISLSYSCNTLHWTTQLQIPACHRCRGAEAISSLWTSAPLLASPCRMSPPVFDCLGGLPLSSIQLINIFLAVKSTKLDIVLR